MDFFPVDWSHEDVFDSSSEPYFRLVACGKTVTGESVCCHVRFTPYFFVETPAEWTDARVRSFAADTADRHGGIASKCVPVQRKSAWGFQNSRKKTLVLVQLAGGNDGLNTVVPASDPAYRSARGTLGIAEEAVLPLIDADLRQAGDASEARHYDLASDAGVSPRWMERIRAVPVMPIS